MSERAKIRRTVCATSSLRGSLKTSPRQTLRGSITVSVHPLLDYFGPWMFTEGVRLQGSYAGARAAHMRVLYPDIVFGAIASSGASCLCFTFSLSETCAVPSGDACRAHQLGIHGRYPARGGPQVFLQPRQLYHHHRLDAQDRHPARSVEKAFWPRRPRVRS